ncbi:MAG TPA: hypothetical protein VN781_05605 [Acidimicrobiales bacterium]|nr:hypothetical protein [Acidimicrobiales bacterium]
MTPLPPWAPHSDLSGPGQLAKVALGVSLVSADTHLLAAGLAESPGAIAERLRLLPGH